jgi:pyridoxal biosynthesis lyase PdxS
MLSMMPVMALERIPADIRYDDGAARMSDPAMIAEIQAAVSIPVMAKVKIPLLSISYHYVETLY